jgi:ferritin-like metal-binding protein YciE
LNLLERTLDEEETTDKNLTDIAKDINDEAFESSQRESASSQY